MAWGNPFAFRTAPVTVWTTIVYITLLTPLIYIHENVPRAPAESALPHGVSLVEAWADLANLTRQYHPFNSRANDEVRDWLLLRTQEILDQNGVAWTTQSDYAGTSKPTSSPPETLRKPSADTVVFNDMLSNVTFKASALSAPVATYFEGSNVAVYIRGTDDDEGDFWINDGPKTSRKSDGAKSMKKRLVLVNSHFDSVPSAFGATDDGVGVTTGLQLMRYFTTPGNKPRRGVVILFNNGEEEGLFGACAFGNSAIYPFIGTFLNLEGAGAGGRAALFRTTDLEVTSAYRGSREPFGSVIGTDGFKMGLIRSETDYRIWADAYGLRGLDMAFYAPRAYYHTRQDDRRHTSKDSVWHMLSSALTTTINLSGAAGDAVDGRSTTGVWFDLFGDSIVLFALRGMFAWSLTILVAGPLILFFIAYVVKKCDKDFIFSHSVKTGEESDEKVSVGGMKGLFRFPLAFVVAGSLNIGAAFLVRKIQPFTIYSSPYAVWAMMLSLFYFSFWCIMRGANFARPSALQRVYVHMWLFTTAWAILVAVAVGEDRMQIASGYVFVFWASQVFLATMISLLDLFALPRKQEFARGLQDDLDVHDHLQAVPHSDAIIAPSPGEIDGDTAVYDDDSVEVEPTETSPLVGGDTRGNTRTTFTTGYRRSIAALMKAAREGPTKSGSGPYKFEQDWSGNMSTWTWFLQFLILGPFMIILTAQLGLLLTSSLHQTGSDGSDLLPPYLVIAAFSMLLLLPLSPFIHRVSRHIPLFCLAVFAGTLAYSLLAFPFSPARPFKVYFHQTLDLDSGAVRTVLTGSAAYTRMVVADLPSAAAAVAADKVVCSPSAGRQAGLVDCAFDGAALAPSPAGNASRGIPPQKGYAGLVNVSATRPGVGNRASIEIHARNTKSCVLRFGRLVSSVGVRGGMGFDRRFEFGGRGGGEGEELGMEEIALWRRDWETGWVVDVAWEDEGEGAQGGSWKVGGDAEGNEEDDEARLELKRGRRRLSGLDGEVVCRWADANTPGTVPALDEAWRYAPSWAIVSIKSRPALVEGTKKFMV